MGGLLGLVLLLWAVSVRSETNPKVFTLEESLQQAFKESPQIKAAQEAVQAAEFKQKQAKTGFFPKLGTQYSYNYQNQPQTITIPAQDNGLIPESKLATGYPKQLCLLCHHGTTDLYRSGLDPDL